MPATQLNCPEDGDVFSFTRFPESPVGFYIAEGGKMRRVGSVPVNPADSKSQEVRWRLLPGFGQIPFPKQLPFKHVANVPLEKMRMRASALQPGDVFTYVDDPLRELFCDNGTALVLHQGELDHSKAPADLKRDAFVIVLRNNLNLLEH